MAGLLDKLAASGGTEPVSVPLGDKQVRVKPPMDWKASAVEAIVAGRFTAWAQTSLVDDETRDEKTGKLTGSDDVAVWNKVDPTVRQVAEFLAAYSELVGISLGE